MKFIFKPLEHISTTDSFEKWKTKSMWLRMCDFMCVYLCVDIHTTFVYLFGYE